METGKMHSDFTAQGGRIDADSGPQAFFDQNAITPPGTNPVLFVAGAAVIFKRKPGQPGIAVSVALAGRALGIVAGNNTAPTIEIDGGAASMPLAQVTLDPPGLRLKAGDRIRIHIEAADGAPSVVVRRSRAKLPPE